MSYDVDLNELTVLNENSKNKGEGKTTSSDKYVQMPEGNGYLIVRILPPAPAGAFGRQKNNFYSAFKIHRLNDRSVYCLKNHSLKDNKAYWSGDCPICQYYSHLWRKSDEQNDNSKKEELQNKARELRPYERYYLNVIVRSNFNKDTQTIEKNVGPKILSVGSKLFYKIIGDMVGDPSMEKKGLGNVTHPMTGRDLKIIKKITKFKAKDGRMVEYGDFSESHFVDPSPLGNPDEVEKWIASLHDLVALRPNHTFEEVKKKLKIYLGVIPDDSSDGGFDSSEYEASGGSASASPVNQEQAKPSNAPQSPKTEEQQVQKPASTPSVGNHDFDGVDDAEDDEFMRNLKNPVV